MGAHFERIGNFFPVWYKSMFHHDEWNIGVVYESIDIFLEPNAKPFIHWFPPPKLGSYLADPFGFVTDNKIYVLCEEFDYRSYIGRIVSYELGPEGPVRRSVAIDLPYHVSYPYLFEDGGEIYCVPETVQASEVALYRADEFPDKWEKVGVLIAGFPAVDSTVFHYEDCWWLICSNKENIESGKLFIWHAKELTGPWKSHNANPVKKDIYSSRPGGTPFVHKGDLYRPAQDCSRTYGGGIVLNRVTRLTPDEFLEEEVTHISPSVTDPYSDGLHTLSAAGKVTLIDGKRRIFVPSAFKRALTRPFVKMARRRLRTVSAGQTAE